MQRNSSILLGGNFRLETLKAMSSAIETDENPKRDHQAQEFEWKEWKLEDYSL